MEDPNEAGQPGLNAMIRELPYWQHHSQSYHVTKRQPQSLPTLGCHATSFSRTTTASTIYVKPPNLLPEDLNLVLAYASHINLHFGHIVSSWPRITRYSVRFHLRLFWTWMVHRPHHFARFADTKSMFCPSLMFINFNQSLINPHIKLNHERWCFHR